MINPALVILAFALIFGVVVGLLQPENKLKTAGLISITIVVLFYLVSILAHLFRIME